MLYNLKVKHRIFIEADFSRSQWNLYDETPVEVVAALNNCLEDLVNSGKSKSDVRERMFKVLVMHETHGATDSDVVRFLDTVLAYVFSE